MTKRQILGLVTSLILLVGAFLPVLNIPFVGEVNYIDLQDANGLLIVIYAIVAIVLTFLRQERWLIIPAGLALLQVGYSFYQLNSQINRVENNIFTNWIKSLEIYDSSSLIGIGWAVMALGAVALALTPYLPLNGGAATRLPRGKSSKDDFDSFI
jgi:hypothetical protein